MLITHGLLATFDEADTLLLDGALRIVGDRITEMGSTTELLARYPDEECLDARGMLVMPGLICAHTHFYGAFARGLPARGEPPANFPEILERLWWRLDRALRPEDIRASVEVCLMDAIRHGTTTLVDHHASPKFIEGSLDWIAEAVLAAGVRACLCYEVSDRDGRELARAGIQENVRFIERCRRNPHPRLAGMMGLHASLTLSDETLEKAIGLARELDVGCHIHVAESKADVADSLKKYGLRVVERLHKAGILNPRAILAHGVHLDDYELDTLRNTGAAIVHNPRSNMHNAVGTARVPRMMRDHILVGLGNDGFSNNMFIEMHVAYLVHKMANEDPRVMPAHLVTQMAFANNRRIVAGLFPAPVGILAPGAMADIIIVDYRPPTPLTAANLPWHIVLGVDGTSVRTTICAGKVLMRDGQLLTLDEEAITARSRELARKLWARF